MHNRSLATPKRKNKDNCSKKNSTSIKWGDNRLKDRLNKEGPSSSKKEKHYNGGKLKWKKYK